MGKVVETPIGKIDYSEYPFISFTVKENEIKEFSFAHIDTFLVKYRQVLDMHEGPFVIFADATNVKWVNKEYRDYFGLNVQAIETEYLDRHKGNFIFVPNVLIYVFTKLLSGFVKPLVPITLSFRKEKFKDKAKAFINKF